MDTSPLIVVAAVFILGGAAGYGIRALISAKRRRRQERTRGYPLAE